MILDVFMYCLYLFIDFKILQDSLENSMAFGERMS